MRDSLLKSFASLTASLLFLSTVFPQWCFAIPSSVEVENAIKKAAIFPAKKQLKVGKFEDGELSVSTYVEESSSDPDKDCKIDALLIAKTLIAAFAEIKRVTVNFYSLSNSSMLKQATITKPEVLSFGAGDVNSSEIMFEIKLIDRSSVVQTSTAPRSAQWARHHVSGQDGFPGLSFQYPKAWVLEQADISPGNSTAFLIKSSASTYHPALIELKAYRTKGNLSVFKETGVHVREHREEKDYKPIDGGEASFGAANSIKGYFENYSVVPEKARVYEYRFYFGWPGFIYVFRSSSTQQDKQNVDGVFKSILRSAQIDRAR